MSFDLCICNVCKSIRKSKIDRFTALHRCVCVQKLSRAFAVTVWMSYISCSACAKTLLLFCVYEQRLCHVFAVYVIAMHVNRPDKVKNRLIYCITQVCRCAKAKSCLRSMCVYVVYELNVWIKRCYCPVCDCAACKSAWKCGKSIDLLHHVCLYMRKSWVVPLQYVCICRMWITACMQRHCCSSVYVQASTRQRLRCYCLAFRLCVSSTRK